MLGSWLHHDDHLSFLCIANMKLWHDCAGEATVDLVDSDADNVSMDSDEAGDGGERRALASL